MIKAPCLPVNPHPVPPYRERLPELLEILADQGSLGLLLIDTTQLNQVEHDYGSEAYRTVLGLATDLVVELQGTEFRGSDILTSSEKAGDAFLVFLTSRRSGRAVRISDLEATATRIEQILNPRLASSAMPYLRGRPRVAVGFGLVLFNPLVMPERLVARLIEEALECARFQRAVGRFQRRAQLLEILVNEQVTTLFQPLMNLRDRSVLGYEALSRGPAGTAYHSPAHLFEVAAESDLVFELDRLCRSRALWNCRDLSTSVKLFVNVLPSAMFDPDFRGRKLIGLLDHLGLSPEQIVLEITEKYAIENYTLFAAAVTDLIEVGFSFAIDDIGAGYSGLEKIANLNPRYLKFDIHLVRDIDASYVRREMVRALKEFADKMESTIIAEGIERAEELAALVELGIDYGQGYLLARPGPRLSPPPIDETAVPIVVEEPVSEPTRSFE